MQFDIVKVRRRRNLKGPYKAKRVVNGMHAPVWAVFNGTRRVEGSQTTHYLSAWRIEHALNSEARLKSISNVDANKVTSVPHLKPTRLR
jgi:hypothetical protein